MNGLYPRHPSPPSKPRQGWECPVCHRGNAPWMPYCSHCKDAAANAAARLAAGTTHA